jgi:hypothetical protein
MQRCTAVCDEDEPIIEEPQPAGAMIPTVPKTGALVPSDAGGQRNMQNNIATQQMKQMNLDHSTMMRDNINVSVININNFGEERIDHITPEMLDERLKEINGRGIFQLIRDIHFNPDIPENHNIRMGSKKRRNLKVKRNGRWEVRDNNDILDIMISQYKRRLSLRSFEPDFKKGLNHEVEFMQIQKDLMNFNKDTNPAAYYGCVRKVLALIEDLDTSYREAAESVEKEGTKEE